MHSMCIEIGRQKREGSTKLELVLSSHSYHVTHALATQRFVFFRKVWVSIKFLSAKFGLPSALPKRAQNEEKLYKSVENPQN